MLEFVFREQVEYAALVDIFKFFPVEKLERKDFVEDKKRLYVGNLPYKFDDQLLLDLFNSVEGVEVAEDDAKIIMDRQNPKLSKGIGFVTVATEEMAAIAIEALNGSEQEGRKIEVSIARPREDRGERKPYNGGRSDFNRPSYR